MHLSDVKIVDLTASVWDKEKSDPKTGEYVFSKKAYIDYSGQAQAKPMFQFSWNLNKPFAIADWQRKWPGTKFVLAGDPYWPEGIAPDAEGRYVFVDTVLMAVPLMAYLAQRRKEIQDARMAPDLAIKGLASEYKAAGVEVSESELVDLMSRRG